MKKEVFISYKVEDFQEADWVRAVLEENGISCWMAPMCIPGGSSYAVEIPNAIAGCDYFVLILSKKAQLSKWISREVDRAINEDKVLLPFVIEACELTPEYKFYLTNVQYYYAYQDKAGAINKLIADIRNRSHASAQAPNREPDDGVDVFISCKASDESGNPTIDSYMALDLYHQLTREGLKVYYAGVSLEGKLGQDYEEVERKALHSARIMLVIGTKNAYLCAPFVKNEWSRFLELKKSDPSKVLIPCYKNMDVFELPRELACLQAMNMDRIGFMYDLLRGIQKIMGKNPR